VKAKGKKKVAASAPAPKPLPVWLPAVVFAAATVLLFPEFFFAGGPLLGTDTYALSYFARHFYTSVVHETGRFPLWQPYLFGGMPFVDGMHGDIFYPPSLALFFLDTRAMWGWKMVLHVFAAGVFTYLFLRQLGLRRGPALFGGLVYMMGADLVSLVYPGGDGKLFVSALAPLAFLLTDRAARRGRLSDYAFFALGLALVMLTSHMQLAYFTVWGVSLFFVFRIGQRYREERRTGALARRLGMFGLAGLLGVGASAVQFLPPLGYLREWSQRAGRTVQAEGESAYEYSSQWSLHPEEAVSLIVPDFVGDNVQTGTRDGNTYWGRNVFKINHEYAGLLPFLLLPLLFVRRRTPETWFFSALGLLAVFYGLGATTPLFRLFYLIPGVNLFRAPSIIIFLFGLSLATLGAMGLQRMLDEDRAPDGPAAPRAHWILAGVFLLLALAQSADIVTNVWQSFVQLDLQKVAALNANLPYIRNGFWITFAFALGFALVREAYLRSWIGAREVVLILCLLAALDAFRVDRPFVRATVLNGRSYERGAGTLFRTDDTIDFLRQRVAEGEVFRTYDLGLILQNSRPVHDYNVLATWGIEQLTGHHGNEPGYYDELMGGDDGARNVALSQTRLLDLANVTYIVSPARINVPSWEEAFTGSRAVVYRNGNALPRAYLAGNVEVVPDSMAVATLLAEGFDKRRTVVLPEPLPAGVTAEPDPEGSVEWTDRQLDAATLRVATDRPTLLVLSDNYYPAWRASVDGQPVEILRANYTFRAVPVPAGEHEVRFEYDASSLKKPVLASVGILVLLLGVGIGGALRGGSGEGEA
jgi:hypothetical protein